MGRTACCAVLCWETLDHVVVLVVDPCTANKRGGVCAGAQRSVHIHQVRRCGILPCGQQSSRADLSARPLL